ncbi:MAG: DUF1648 domain-containing protein [Thermoanaerobaculia bacterium]|nr:DUF1648 domain-containing protein [Thermoanaerobaculia bacterium]
MTEHVAGLLIAMHTPLIGIVFWMTPSWSRPEHFFGVTVPADFRDGALARDILERFRRRVLIASVIAVTASALTVVWRPEAVLLLAVILFAQLGGFQWAFFTARRATLPFSLAPTSVRQAVVIRQREKLPGGLGLQLLPFVILGVAAVVLALGWERIPETLVTHWNARGEADSWAEKSPLMAAAPLLVGAALCVAMVILGHGISRWSRRVSVEGEAGRLEARRHRATLYVLLASQIVIAVLFALISLMALVPAGAGSKAAVGAILFLSMGGSVVILVVVGIKAFPSTNVKARADEAAVSGRPIGDRTPDACWKLGMFYFNPDDPALFIEKRFGFGYDFNFARPGAWAVLGMLVGLPLAMALLVAWTG